MGCGRSISRCYRAKDLVLPLDVGSPDTGQLKALAGITVQRLMREGGLEHLDLISDQLSITGRYARAGWGNATGLPPHTRTALVTEIPLCTWESRIVFTSPVRTLRVH
jgi:hypothetical protein